MDKLPTTCMTALAPLTWGTTYLVATQLLPPGRPLLAAALRALPIGLLLLVGARQLPRGRWWWRACTLGTLNIGAFFAFLFVAAERLPGGVAATVGAATPLLVTALAWPALGNRPTPRTLAAGLAGLAGITLLVLRADARLDALGVLAGLAGSLSSATGIVLTKPWGRPATPLLVFTAWQLVAGGVLLAPFALLVEGPAPSLGPRAPRLVIPGARRDRRGIRPMVPRHRADTRPGGRVAGAPEPRCRHGGRFPGVAPDADAAAGRGCGAGAGRTAPATSAYPD